MKVSPKESFCGELNNGYQFKLAKSNWYICNLIKSIYYVIDKFGMKIPFDEKDFFETFKIM